MSSITRTYYSIREVSEMLSVPASTLRYWEQQVEQLQPTTRGTTRFYSQEDIELVKRIQYLRTQNVPVADISRRLRLDKKGIDTRQAAYEQLHAIRAELVALRDMI